MSVAPTKLLWGLSPWEADTVQAVINTGCNKSAARQRGVTLETVKSQMSAALRKSGKGNRVQMLIAYDRHVRGTR